ncbi:penicillin-binding transpeptidase domain-containing protein [Dactylosporangium sp. NPDC050588]|uniref:penicillin-binding transpeptidase domain-containing protein n=1 Tax=Dactylosporangium sp. NPDC050588 TaxID=3157211 RepID=UPI0033C4990D
MAGDGPNVSIIESAHQDRPGGRRTVLLAAVLVVAAVVGVVVWRSRDTDPPKGTAAPAARASELFAADGTTLIARFDTEDPRESCLRAPVNDWGFFCDSVVTWWQGQEAFGADKAERTGRLRQGGYRIVGSLDPKLQVAAKQRVDAVVPVTDPNVFSVASIEPGTGLIRAMAANRNFRRAAAAAVSPGVPSGDGPPAWPYTGPDATDALVAGDENMPGTQAGAPFMMFTLAAALEGGLKLDHAIDTKKVYQSKFRIDPQSPLACNGGYYCPTNAGDKAYQSGRRTMWDAFGHTVVTYFVELEERIGVEKAVALAQRLGITFRAKEDQALGKNSAMWGAFTLGVSATSTLDLANAYATLAADGTHCDPLPVAKVTDATGAQVPGVGPNCESVLRPEVARAAIDAARCPVGDASAFGDRCGAGAVPASTVRATVGRPVAGQSGVTDSRRACSVVIAGPQLATAGMIATAPWARTGQAGIPAGVPEAAIGAVATVQHDGLAPLPVRDFTAPPREVALA